MGTRDYYVAAVKGAILSQLPEARIVDVSHHVQPFDIVQASFILKNAYPSFPPGTVHIIGVNPDADANTPHLCVAHDGQYFIGSDNGIFSLMFKPGEANAFELQLGHDSDDLTFPTRDVFVKAACHLARGGTPEVIGAAVGGVRQAIMFQATVEGNGLKGQVIYIDSYGNIITNITEQLFKEVGRDRPFTIYFRREEYDINEIHTAYNQVPEGEKLAIFSASGNLEIAINKGVEGSGGGASTLFGLKLNDIVSVAFHDR